MIQTPLKHVVSSGHTASMSMSATRCRHGAVSHEAPFVDWMDITPSQVSMMSSPLAPPILSFTPPNDALLQSAIERNIRINMFTGASDFLSSSPLPLSSPFASLYAQATQSNMHFPSQTSALSIEISQNLHHSATQSHHSTPISSSIETHLLQSVAEYLAHSDPPQAFASLSPIDRHCETTPVTTLSVDERTSSMDIPPVADVHQLSSGLAAHVDICAPSHPPIDSEDNRRPLIDLLREASSSAPEGETRSSPVLVQKMQTIPLESSESPFRIVQPQPRPFTAVDSSPLTSLVTSGSELFVSGQSTPSLLSRPSSALSTGSQSPSKLTKVPRQLPPRRFSPSPFYVDLPQVQLTPSMTDVLMENQRGPLEFEKDAHRYRTRSKLKSLKAEILEKEREHDLAHIRRGMRKAGLLPLYDYDDDASSASETDVDVNDSPRSRLEVLAIISARKRKRAQRLPSPSRSPAPSTSSVISTSVPRATRPKRETTSKLGVKRTMTDMESVGFSTSSGIETRRSIAKRAKTERLDAPEAALGAQAALGAKVEARPARSSRTRNTTSSARLAPTSERDREKVLSAPSSISTGRNSPKVESTASYKEVKCATSNQSLIRYDHEQLDISARNFPLNVEIHAAFPLLYRKFPLCVYLDPANPKYPTSPGPLPGGHFNAPRSALDLYTPRFVRGVGREKAGLCPICYESKARGGAGKTEWLSMKFSAFNYHMQYAHGISPTTTLPFSPPIAFRSVARKQNHKNEKTEILEGLCHRCDEWVPVEGVKCVEAKLKEIYWWKHAAGCHKGSMIEGEADFHLEDDYSRRVIDAFAAHCPQGPSMSKARSIMGTPQNVPFGH